MAATSTEHQVQDLAEKKYETLDGYERFGMLEWFNTNK